MNKRYLQTHGTAMGTRMGPSYANLFLAKFETDTLTRAPFQPYIWWRYMDDIFMIWTRSVQDLNTFTSFLNNIHPTVKFTCDYTFTSIPFLDVNVSLHNGEIVTDLYTKPTDKHQYLLHSSCHPIHTKRAIPFSLSGLDSAAFVLPTRPSYPAPMNLLTIFTNVTITTISINGKYTRLTISHGQKHLRHITLSHWTNQNVFPSLSPTTQPFVPSRPLFAKTFTPLLL